MFRLGRMPDQGVQQCAGHTLISRGQQLSGSAECRTPAVFGRIGTGSDTPRSFAGACRSVRALGGFTTFSAFGLETVHLLKRGEMMTAAAYVLASVLGGIAAILLAYRFTA